MGEEKKRSKEKMILPIYSSCLCSVRHDLMDSWAQALASLDLKDSHFQASKPEELLTSS